MARQLEEVNASGELVEIKLGGTGAEKVVTTKEYVDQGLSGKQDTSGLETAVKGILSGGTVTDYKKNGSATENEVLNVTEMDTRKMTKWKGRWAASTYYENDMVLDDGWLMICLQETQDRAAPQTSGVPYNAYDGSIGEAQVSAKQIIFGTRYTPSTVGSVQITGYRVYTKVGNEYQVYIVADPQGAKIISRLHTFTGAVDGWDTLALNPVIVDDEEFDLVVISTEPDPSPVTWTANYQYITPQNESIPAAGNIQQANRTLGVMSISYLDDDATDRTAALQALTVGDVIDDGFVRWAIQSTTDQGTHIDFGVSPASQSVDGTRSFSFETVASTPITYGQDIGYYTTVDWAKGLLGIDTDYDNVTPDNNAYGADLFIQNIVLSPDWEAMASTTSTGSSHSNLYKFNKATDVLDIPAQPTWTPVVSVVTDEAIVGKTYEFKFAVQGQMTDTNDSAYLRYRANTGGWTELSKEAKDNSDTFAVSYFFPIKADSNNLSFEIEMAKEAGGSTLNVYFADAIIDQKD